MKRDLSIAFSIAMAVFLTSANAHDCPCKSGEIQIIEDGKCKCIIAPHMMPITGVNGVDAKITSVDPSILQTIAKSLSAESTMQVVPAGPNFSVSVTALTRENTKDLLSKFGQPATDLPQ